MDGVQAITELASYEQGEGVLTTAPTTGSSSVTERVPPSVKSGSCSQSRIHRQAHPFASITLSAEGLQHRDFPHLVSCGTGLPVLAR
jgi:hypothetical protein